jgi:hypothetical protein
MTVVTLHDPERAKLQAEVITLAHEIVHRVEVDPSHAAVAQLAWRIEATANRLNQ